MARRMARMAGYLVAAALDGLVLCGEKEGKKFGGRERWGREERRAREGKGMEERTCNSFSPYKRATPTTPSPSPHPSDHVGCGEKALWSPKFPQLLYCRGNDNAGFGVFF